MSCGADEAQIVGSTGSRVFCEASARGRQWQIEWQIEWQIARTDIPRKKIRGLPELTTLAPDVDRTFLIQPCWVVFQLLDV